MGAVSSHMGGALNLERKAERNVERKVERDVQLYNEFCYKRLDVELQRYQYVRGVVCACMCVRVRWALSAIRPNWLEDITSF